MLKPKTVDKVIELTLRAYSLAKNNIETGKQFYTKEVQTLLEDVDAYIHHETKPRLVKTNGGLELLISATGDFKNIQPPTRDSIMQWLKTQHLV